MKNNNKYKTVESMGLVDGVAIATAMPPSSLSPPIGRRRSVALRKEGGDAEAVIDGRPRPLGARGAESGAGGASPPASSILETENNNVAEYECVERVYLMREHRCRTRTCPTCGKHYGHQVRKRLLSKQHLLKGCALMTLTVDRDGIKTGRGFDSAQDAHKYITSKRLISHLMRHLGIKRWVWTLEFHEKSDDGWPHWHVLVDLSEFPNGQLPKDKLIEAWRWWRDKWQIGGLHLKSKCPRVDGTKHAIMYVTKYLTKYPKRGFPRWVVESSRIRFCGSSREIGALVTENKHTEDKEDTKSTKVRRESSPLVERMARCCEETDLFVETIDERTGERLLRWAATVPGRLDDLEFLTRSGVILADITSNVEVSNYTSWDGQTEKVYRPCRYLRGIPIRFEDSIKNSDYAEELEWRVCERTREYLDTWVSRSH